MYNRSYDCGKVIRSVKMEQDYHIVTVNFEDSTWNLLPYNQLLHPYQSTSPPKVIEERVYQKSYIKLDTLLLRLRFDNPDDLNIYAGTGNSTVSKSIDNNYLAWIDKKAILHLDLIDSEQNYAEIGPLSVDNPAFSFSPDGRLLALRIDSVNLALFNVWEGKWYRNFQVARPAGSKLIFSYASLLFELGGQEAICYDVEYATEVFRIPASPIIRPLSANLSENGNQVQFYGRLRYLNCELAGIINEYLRYRTLSDQPFQSMQLSAMEAPIEISVDSSLIPARKSMVWVARKSLSSTGSGGSGSNGRGGFRIDNRLLDEQAVVKFTLAGGYTLPCWWSGDGLSYTLANKALSSVCPVAAPGSLVDNLTRTAFISGYEAEALAAYLGKRLPDNAQWDAAAEQGVIHDGSTEEIWEWSVPSQEYQTSGYESLDKLFRYPLKMLSSDRLDCHGRPATETWIVPGYFRSKTSARFVLE